MGIKIGVALLNNRIETAVVAKSRHFWRLLENFTLPLEENNLLETLAELKNKLQHFGRIQLNLGIHYTQVLIKELKLDNCLSLKQVLFYIKQNSIHLLGQPFEYWLIDFEKYSEHSYKVCAAPRENIFQLLSIFKNAGLRVRAVFVDIFAISRLCTSFQFYQPEHYLGIICVYHFEVLLIVCQNGQLVYHKKTICSLLQEVPRAISALLQFYNTFLPDKPLNQLFYTKEIKLNDDIWQVTAHHTINELTGLGLTVYDN